MRIAYLLLAVALGISLRCESRAADAATAVPHFPIGWCILAQPDAFAGAKQAGYEYVELAMQGVLPLNDAEFEKLRAELAASGLPALAGYNLVPADLRLVGPAVEAARLDSHVAHVIQRAQALGLRYLILNAGAAWRVPDGFSRAEAFAQLAGFSRRFATAASATGMTVLVEPLRPTDSNLIVSIDEAVRLVASVGHPNFGMMVDYSFLRIGKDDPAALLKAGRHLRHVHMANPDKNPRAYPLDPRESDYASFFAVLKQIGYRGGLSVHAGSKEPLVEAPMAIAFLRSQAEQLARRE